MLNSQCFMEAFNVYSRDIEFKLTSDFYFFFPNSVDPFWKALQIRIQLIVWGHNRTRNKLRRNILLPCSFEILDYFRESNYWKIVYFIQKPKQNNWILGGWIQTYYYHFSLNWQCFSRQVKVCVKNAVWGEKCFWRHKF